MRDVIEIIGRSRMIKLSLVDRGDVTGACGRSADQIILKENCESVIARAVLPEAMAGLKAGRARLSGRHAYPTIWQLTAPRL
jgi:hypothetical protein